MDSKWRFLIELISSIAILISLLFLGIETRQGNLLAKATVRQTINDNDIEFLETYLDASTLPIANHKLATGEELSAYEIQQIIWQQHINFRIFDNGYYQFQNGLLDKEEWLKYKSIITTLLQTNPYVTTMWNQYGDNFSHSFQMQIAAIKSEVQRD